MVDEKLFTGVFVWRDDLPASLPLEGATTVKKKNSILPADSSDAEDFDVTANALDRAQHARLIRKTRTGLGLP